MTSTTPPHAAKRCGPGALLVLPTPRYQGIAPILIRAGGAPAASVPAARSLWHGVQKTLGHVDPRSTHVHADLSDLPLRYE